MAQTLETPPTNIRGSASEFNVRSDGKYVIKEHSYPYDIYNNDGIYGGNFVVFYINVAEDSKILAEELKTAFTDEIPRMRGDIAASNASATQAIAAASATGAITGVGVAGFSKILSSVGGRKSSTGGNSSGIVGALKDTGKAAAVGAAIGGVAAGAVALAAGGKMARQQKRITTAIALHIPNQLNIRYSMQWTDEETMLYQAGLAINPSVAKSMTGKETTVAATVESIAASVALSKTPGIAGALSAASGLAANPKKEQIFKNVSHREFAFDYTFSPRDAKEAENVRNIINTFKLHMHPEYKDANNFVFIFPSEFDIFYYQGTKENLNIHRHTSCVLKDMNINYTPNGLFTTFDDGMPTQINVTLSFLELAILTKEQMKDYY
jgi:hypothetical protein